MKELLKHVDPHVVHVKKDFESLYFFQEKENTCFLNFQNHIQFLSFCLEKMTQFDFYVSN